MPKADLLIDPPLLNAAGFLGYAPEQHKPAEPARFGAFVSNPISLEPRQPARNATCLPFPGGFLLHNGYPNPGLRRAIRQYAPAWARSPVPVVICLLPQGISDIPAMIAPLEGLPGVMGVEICPPPGDGEENFQGIVQAAFGELAVLLRLSPEKAMKLLNGRAEDLLDSGLAAVSMGAPRGALVDSFGRLVHGRLYGPAIYPQTLMVARALTAAGFPVIAGGGVYRPEQADQLLKVGATGVQLDAVLWRDPALESWDTS
jgi:dihydroorotate dehydrogenase (NAD+) catalytic subunit